MHEQDPIEFEEFLEREFPLTEEEEFKFALPPKDKKSFTLIVSLGKNLPIYIVITRIFNYIVLFNLLI